MKYICLFLTVFFSVFDNNLYGSIIDTNLMILECKAIAYFNFNTKSFGYNYPTYIDNTNAYIVSEVVKNEIYIVKIELRSRINLERFLLLNSLNKEERIQAAIDTNFENNYDSIKTSIFWNLYKIDSTTKNVYIEKKLDSISKKHFSDDKQSSTDVFIIYVSTNSVFKSYLVNQSELGNIHRLNNDLYKILMKSNSEYNNLKRGYFTKNKNYIYNRLFSKIPILH